MSQFIAVGQAGCRRSFPRQLLCRITTRAWLLATVVITQLVHAQPILADQLSRPNIVFIMADDLGWNDVQFHGEADGPKRTPTPNLNRLAATSLELKQHYVAPVCTPTRAGLLTGRYWSRFGLTAPRNERCLPWDTITLPGALGEAGYDTCLVGKWHLGSKPAWGPNRFGFDHSYGSLAGGVNPWKHFYKEGPYSKTWHRNGDLITEQGHVTDLLTSEAIRWLEGRSDKPFFLYVPFTAVHLPVDEPKEWLDRVPQAIAGEVPRQYAACTMHLDDAVGKIMQALERLGRLENTIVVFTSDNGGSTSENNDTRYPFNTYPQGKLTGNNLPLRGKKGDLYEGGIRVPTLVHWPSRWSGGEAEIPVHIADWMPTFCSLAGYAPASDLAWDGIDILPALTGKAKPPTRLLYWAGTNFRTQAIRDGDWKLLVRGAGGKAATELYNLKSDPNEKTDLADSEKGRVTGMLAQLREIAKNDRDAEVSD